MDCRHWSRRKHPARSALAAFLIAATVFVACDDAIPAEGRSNHPLVAVPFEQHREACVGKDGWNDPAPPIRIFANVYDVGTCGLVVLLLTGPKGDILIDSGTAEAAPDIARNIERLGEKLSNIRLMLLSHEHLDHVGGAAELKRRTGARLMVLPEARYAVESGSMSPDDPQSGLWPAFPPARVDALLRDGQTVTVGPLKLTAHATYGHSRGSTSWTWTSCEGPTCRAFVYADSVTAPAAPGYRFSDHPDRVARFRASLAKIAALRCDILVTPHPAVSNFYQRMSGASPLVDPGACAAYAATASRNLDERLASESAK